MDIIIFSFYIVYISIIYFIVQSCRCASPVKYTEVMNVLLLLASGVLVFLWLRWRIKNRKLLDLSRKLPGPKQLPLLGNALQLMVQPEELVRVIKDMTMDYGLVMRIWLGPDLNVMVTDPDDLRTLLTSSKTSVKGQQYKYMADVLGGGILSGSGPIWRKHRKIATPNYGKRAIGSYADIFNREVDELLLKFRGLAGQEVNIYDSIVRATSYTVCQSLMGLSKKETMELPHFEYLVKMTPRCYDIVFYRMTTWWLQIDPVFWLTSYCKDQTKFIQLMTEFCKTIVKHRVNTLKSVGEERKINLMESLEDSSSNTQLSVIDRFILSDELNEEELVQETFTIFTSSQEATAKISSFLLLMLAYHPDCQDKLYQEIISVMGDSDRAINDEDLKMMPYLDMVFKEVIRLFPIGAILQRTVTEDIQLKSVTLPPGCSLLFPIYHMHRDPRYWTNPDGFDPERFSVDNSRDRHPYCYLPFSLGPMDCLGRHFAIKLVKTLCVRVLREFQIRSRDSYKDFRVCIAISVVSLNGYSAILTTRKHL